MFKGKGLISPSPSLPMDKGFAACEVGNIPPKVLLSCVIRGTSLRREDPPTVVPSFREGWDHLESYQGVGRICSVKSWAASRVCFQGCRRLHSFPFGGALLSSSPSYSRRLTFDIPHNRIEGYRADAAWVSGKCINWINYLPGVSNRCNHNGTS